MLFRSKRCTNTKLIVKSLVLKTGRNFMVKESMERRIKYVRVGVYHPDVPYIWKTDCFCCKSGMGDYKNSMYHSAAATIFGRYGICWPDWNCIAYSAGGGNCFAHTSEAYMIRYVRQHLRKSW